MRGCADVAVSSAVLATQVKLNPCCISLNIHLPLGFHPECSEIPSQLKVIIFNTLFRVIIRFWWRFFVSVLFGFFFCQACLFYIKLLLIELSVPTPTWIESETFGVGTMLLPAFRFKRPYSVAGVPRKGLLETTSIEIIFGNNYSVISHMETFG